MRLKGYCTKVHSTRDILWILDSKIVPNTLGKLYPSSRSTSSEVSKHIHIEPPGYYVDLDQVKILDGKSEVLCERGHLHPSQQSITQQGQVPIQVT